MTLDQNGIGACSTNLAAVFKQVMQSLCNGTNKFPGTVVSHCSRSGPTPTGDYYKRFIAGHITLNHIKKPTILLTIKSLGSYFVSEGYE